MGREMEELSPVSTFMSAISDDRFRPGTPEAMINGRRGHPSTPVSCCTRDCGRVKWCERSERRGKKSPLFARVLEQVFFCNHFCRLIIMNDLIKLLLEGVITGALGIFGVLGNIASFNVLSSRDLDMIPTFRHLMRMLSAFDAIFLFFTVSLFSISAWSDW